MSEVVIIRQPEPRDIESPEALRSIAEMHARSWRDTYIDISYELSEGEMIDRTVVQQHIDEKILSDAALEKRERMLKLYLDSPDSTIFYCLVEAADGQIVGFIMGEKRPTDEKQPADQELCELYLDKSVHSRGLGDRLVKSFINWVDPERPTMLGVFSFNKRAIKLYEKFGFAIDSEPMHKYAGMSAFTMIREKTA